MKSIVLILIAAVTASIARSDVVLSPMSGNDATAIPFLTTPSQAPSVRYQQVYAASDFLFYVTNVPIFITELSFSPGSGPGGGGLLDRILTNVVITLSTTAKMPDGLSTIFSENLGTNSQVVYSGSLLVVAPCCSGFPFHIRLQTPFLYDPRAGNLLLDVRNYQTAYGPPFPQGNAYLAAETSSNDTVSSVGAFDVNSPTATLNLGSLGLVTVFTVWPIPTVTIARAVNSVVLRWRNQPGGFTVEQASALGAGASWQPAAGTVSTNGAFKEVRLPLQAQTPARFFRLVLPPPTNALQRAASEFVITPSKP